MTITDMATGRKIRHSDNVLATDEGGSIVDGHFTMVLSGDDNPMLDRRRREEDHLVEFKFQYELAGYPTPLDGIVTIVVRVIHAGRH